MNFTYKPKQYVLCSGDVADRVIEVNKKQGVFLLTEIKSQRKIFLERFLFSLEGGS